MSRNDSGAEMLGCAVIIVWLLGVTLSLGMIGVGIWAVIRLVSHYT